MLLVVLFVLFLGGGDLLFLFLFFWFYGARTVCRCIMQKDVYYILICVMEKGMRKVSFLCERNKTLTAGKGRGQEYLFATFCMGNVKSIHVVERRPAVFLINKKGNNTVVRT